MKAKIESKIKDFISACNTYFAISSANFASENFFKTVENSWDTSKTDEDNLAEIKSVFELNRALNENLGNTAAAKTIKAFQEGWLDKID